MSSDQHKTMLSEASGYVPEYSAQAHSGSQELAVHGLSSDEVAKLTAAGKVNAQNNKSSRTLWSIMRAHLFTVFNLVLGLCGLVVILYQRWADLLFLFAVVANVIIGFVQEYKAKLELDRISLLDRSPITAVRDGAMIEVPMESLVEGDVVVLKRGDQVPADAVVLTSDSLELDESLLTGENDPIPKRPGDMVLSASSVLGGTGRVLLSAVGSESRASKISDEARQFSRIQSELRDALDRVVRWITFGLAIIIPIVLWGQVRAAGGLEIVNRDGLWENVAIAVVSSVASMIPQGLALMTTLAFAAAAVALGRKHNILVQEQPAVEVLARVDTVCFDKTGTLTEGGVIFDSVRSLTTPAEAKAPDENQAWRASLPQGWDQALAWFGHDENANPTAAALTGGFEQAPTEQVSGIVPFSSALRFSAIEFKSSGAWLLGAPEALLNQGTEERERARELASLGLRTMVLAHASAVVRNDDGDPVQHIPTDHTPVLFVIFRENVRSDAPEIVDYFNRQGVTLKVFSGDNPYTVQAAAKTAGMDISAGAIDASTLPEDGPELAEAAATHNIFGRVSPEQKKNMVISLKEQGHVVAMTGDGINDALALKHANLGIAMGNAAPATKSRSRRGASGWQVLFASCRLGTGSPGDCEYRNGSEPVPDKDRLCDPAGCGLRSDGADLPVPAPPILDRRFPDCGRILLRAGTAAKLTPVCARVLAPRAELHDSELYYRGGDAGSGKPGGAVYLPSGRRYTTGSNGIVYHPGDYGAVESGSGSTPAQYRTNASLRSAFECLLRSPSGTASRQVSPV